MPILKLAGEDANPHTRRRRCQHWQGLVTRRLGHLRTRRRRCQLSTSLAQDAIPNGADRRRCHPRQLGQSSSPVEVLGAERKASGLGWWMPTLSVRSPRHTRSCCKARFNEQRGCGRIGSGISIPYVVHVVIGITTGLIARRPKCGLGCWQPQPSTCSQPRHRSRCSSWQRTAWMWPWLCGCLILPHVVHVVLKVTAGLSRQTA